MKKLIDLLRWITPFGLLNRHWLRSRMRRLGLPGTRAMTHAVDSCRYELWPLELRRPSEPWVLVDVGANEGEFSSGVSRLVRLAGVHAFEPQAACHPILNRALNEIPNSRLHPVAVGDKNGEIELVCTSNSYFASVLEPHRGIAGGYEPGDFDIQRRVKVPVVRLDDAIPPGTKIGLLKIDVQGYELPVLEGARETLRTTHALLMEVNYVPHYEKGAAFDALHEAVRRHGFRTFGVSAPYVGPDGPLWADALFVRI